jgi:hypothetical protein
MHLHTQGCLKILQHTQKNSTVLRLRNPDIEQQTQLYPRQNINDRTTIEDGII